MNQSKRQRVVESAKAAATLLLSLAFAAAMLTFFGLP